MRELAVAAAFGGEIDDDGARRHTRDHFLRDEDGRFFAGNHGRGDDDVVFGDDFAEKFALAFVKAFVLRGSVTAGVLRVLRFDRQFDETGAEALDLLFHDGAKVVGGNDGTEATRSGDRLKPGDADAENQNARG